MGSGSTSPTNDEQNDLFLSVVRAFTECERAACAEDERERFETHDLH